DLLVELLDDLGGGSLRWAEAVPITRLVARQKFPHSRHIGPPPRTSRRGYRQGAQLPVPDIFGLCRWGGGQHLELSAGVNGKRGRSPAIRHVNQVDAAHQLEQLAGNMADSPVTR